MIEALQNKVIAGGTAVQGFWGSYGLGIQAMSRLRILACEGLVLFLIYVGREVWGFRF